MIPAKDKTFTPWSDEQDEILMAHGGHKIDKRGWHAIALRIPGRTAAACRIRYYAMRKAERGEPKRVRTRERRSNARILSEAKAGMQPPLPEIPPTVPFNIAVALILGDPLPGRSALDRQKLQQQQTGVSR